MNMGYAQALDRAWVKNAGLTKEKRIMVKFLADEYEIDLENKKIISVSCNAPAKEHVSVILLHYLAKKLRLKALPRPTGKWVDFRELEGGAAYYTAFKKRTIDVVLRKYGDNPAALLDLIERFGGRKVQIGDTGIAIEPLENVPVLITASKIDEEFWPDSNILFDETISQIFCTEDIVVLTEIIAHSL